MTQLVIDFSRIFLYTLRIESERHMRNEQELQEEQRKAEARVQRWNESVRQVREGNRQWQRDNAHLGPFLHPVEDEESWRKFLTFRENSGILFVMKVRDIEEMKKETIFTVTFTDGGEVFIQAMDEAHARRIIANNGLWHRNTEDQPFERTIKKIEKANR